MLGQVIKITLKSISANKMRSFLTMLGVIIGVVAVIVLVSIGQGTVSSVTGAITSMGSDLITVMVTDDTAEITREQAEALSEYDSIKDVAPVLGGQYTAKAGSQTQSSTVTGITPSYFTVQDISVQSGRLINDADLEYRTSVAVIGTEVAEQLFESYDVIGRSFTMAGREFLIVGLLEDAGTSMFGSANNVILLPYSTLGRITGQKTLNTFYVRAASAEMVTRAQNITEFMLYSATGDEDSYEVYNQSAILDALDSVLSTMSIMLGGIGGISLLVGGIGIMNIMLVCVSERTREIGVRKAIGAKKRDIMAQFLVEACVLSLMGGLIGVALSGLLVWVFSLILGVSITLSWGISLATLAFCVLIGLVFGGYPAAKAAKLPPIEALRQ